MIIFERQARPFVANKIKRQLEESGEKRLQRYVTMVGREMSILVRKDLVTGDNLSKELVERMKAAENTASELANSEEFGTGYVGYTAARLKIFFLLRNQYVYHSVFFF